MNHVKKPIFFIGMGRSGSTILFEAFSYHKDLGWFSNYLSRYPNLNSINLLARLFWSQRGEKAQGRSINIIKKRLPKAVEAYSIWEKLVGKKFRYTFLRNINPTEKEKEVTKKYVAQMLVYQGKNRFCAKITGPPRIHFLKNIFPDAFFVDLVRDPRAVIASQLGLELWKKRGGYTRPIWEDALDKESYRLWRVHNNSPVALAALQWGAVYEQTMEEKQSICGQYIKIHYEDFMENPVENIKKITQFTKLRPSNIIIKFVKQNQYKNMNYKYSKQLSKKEIELIESILKKQMKDLKYL